MNGVRGAAECCFVVMHSSIAVVSALGARAEGISWASVSLRLLLPSPDHWMEKGGSHIGCSHNNAILHSIIFLFFSLLFKAF